MNDIEVGSKWEERRRRGCPERTVIAVSYNGFVTTSHPWPGGVYTWTKARFLDVMVPVPPPDKIFYAWISAARIVEGLDFCGSPVAWDKGATTWYTDKEVAHSGLVGEPGQFILAYNATQNTMEVAPA